MSTAKAIAVSRDSAAQQTGLLEGDQREISGVVQFAERLNSASLGRPWSKHSKGTNSDHSAFFENL